MVLARDPEVIALLAAPAEPRPRPARRQARRHRRRGRLRRCIYLVDRDGIAIAASNAGTPESFVGSDYGFRTYFTGRWPRGRRSSTRSARSAAGPGSICRAASTACSGRSASSSSRSSSTTLEARWRESGLVVQVTDADGVVLATTEPGVALRHHAAARRRGGGARRAAARRRAARAGARAPARTTGRRGIDGRPYVAAGAAVGPSAPGWRLTAFLPAEPALTPRRAARR